jgi:kynurenine formamidase
MPIIDLSATIENANISPVDRTEIAYHGHAEGAEMIQNIFGVSPDLIRNREGWAVEEFTYFHTHGTTHVDAPWHYNSEIGGKPAPTIDELPLDWFFADGVKLDMRHKGDGEAVTTEDIESALAAIPRKLQERDIVLIQSGADQYYGQPDYMMHGCGVTAEATVWLYDQGVRVMGIDAWGWDAPLHIQAQQAAAENNPGVFWAAHQCGRNYCQIERLVNLDALPAAGFKVACFPLKIKGGSAGPARVVAILPEE